MIKLVVFDLDGVLVDAREIHYEAMNAALEEASRHLQGLEINTVPSGFCISREEHLSKYDGLPTRKKLQMLTKEKFLPERLHDDVWKWKQAATQRIIKRMGVDYDMRHVLSELKAKYGCKIYCASNSIRKTVKLMLLKRGLLEYIDDYFSNEDVKLAKPHPEMYLRCMVKASASPSETLVFEDSHVGRAAALGAGAHLYSVETPRGFSVKEIEKKMDEINEKDVITKVPWKSDKLNVLIPMAGAGSRFQKAGYTFPKPLIEVNGKPMIQAVVENLNVDANFIFIVQQSHYDKYNLKYLLNLIKPNCQIVTVNGMTEGAACTTLLAKELIDNDAPLLMANSDQYLDWESNEFLYSMMADEIDAGILTFKATHPKWSFAKLDEHGFVSEVAEKKPISDLATCGVYYWKHGSDYVKYAEQMIERDIRTNNEFYVCPVFNEAIGDGKKVKTFNIEGMHGIGTPEDLNRFLETHK